jgi:hypothetical protein
MGKDKIGADMATQGELLPPVWRAAFLNVKNASMLPRSPPQTVEGSLAALTMSAEEADQLAETLCSRLAGC